MQLSTTARRAVVGAAMALPLVVAVPGVALAADGSHGGNGGHGSQRGDGDCAGQTAVQGGGLLGVVAGVNPSTNIGNILNLFGTQAQNAQTASNTNSGIQQAGCGDGGRHAFQAPSLVSAVLGVNPSTNVGNIGNVGGTQVQNATTGSNTNGGVQQDGGSSDGGDRGHHQGGGYDGGGHDGGGYDGGHSDGGHDGGHSDGGHDGGHSDGGHGGNGGHDGGQTDGGDDGGARHRAGGQTAVQGGSLIGVTAGVNPSTNVGNIGNVGGTQVQNAQTASNTNSGVQQSGDTGRHHRGGDQTAVQGPSLIGLDVGVNPSTNVGNILNVLGSQGQNAGTASNTNSGVQQGR